MQRNTKTNKLKQSRLNFQVSQFFYLNFRDGDNVIAQAAISRNAPFRFLSKQN